MQQTECCCVVDTSVRYVYFRFFQVLGGYFSDRLGGQRVIFLAAIAWSLITFWMPNILLLTPKSWPYSIPFIVAVRIINGACQGVHFPSMISLTSQVNTLFHGISVSSLNSLIDFVQPQNLSSSERTSFFSMLTSGSALGTLLTGILGSFILDYFGWPSAFRIIGFLGLAWALMMRFYAMSSDRNRIINLSIPNRLCTTHGGSSESVPWLRLFGRASFWAMVITHACQNNCFFVLLSWLPTYFHDGFPHAKVWYIVQILCQFLCGNFKFSWFFFCCCFRQYSGLDCEHGPMVGLATMHITWQIFNGIFNITRLVIDKNTKISAEHMLFEPESCPIRDVPYTRLLHFIDMYDHCYRLVFYSILFAVFALSVI